MGLNCRISYDSNSNPIVANDNGTPSKLYKDALELTGSVRDALDIWATASTPEFQEAFGRVNNNDDVTLNEVLKFYNSKKAFWGKLSPSERYEIKSLMKSLGFKNLSGLVSTMQKVFRPNGVVDFSPELAITSGLFLPQDLDNINLTEINELLTRMEGELMLGDFEVTVNEPEFFYRDPENKNILGASQVVTQDQIDQEVMAMISDFSSEAEFYQKMNDLPYTDFTDKFYEDKAFAQKYMAKFAGMRRVPVATISRGKVVTNQTQTLSKVANTIESNLNTLDIEAEQDYLRNIPEPVWMTSQEQIKEIVREVEAEFAKVGVDIIGLSNKTLDRATILDVIGTAVNMARNPSQANMNVFASSYDRAFQVIPETSIERIPQEYAGLTILKIHTQESPKTLWDQHGLIKVGENLYQKINKKDNKAELYKYLYQRVLDGDLVIPEKFATEKDLNNVIGVRKNLEAFINSRDTGFNFFDEDFSLYQVAFNHLPVTKHGKDADRLLSMIETDEEYLKTDFVADFHKYILQEKLKGSEVYKNVLSQIEISDNDITINGAIDSLEGVEMQQEFLDYLKLKKDPSVKMMIPVDTSAAPIEVLVATNFPERVTEYTGRTADVGNLLITAPVPDKYIRVGQNVYKKIATNRKAHGFVLVEPNPSEIYYATKERLAPYSKDQLDRLMKTQDMVATTKLSAKDIQDRKDKVGMDTTLLQKIRQKSKDFAKAIKFSVVSKPGETTIATTSFELNLIEFLRQKGLQIVTDQEVMKKELEDSMPMVAGFLGRGSSTNITVNESSVTVRQNSESPKLKTMGGVKGANDYYAKKIHQGLKEKLGALYRPNYVKSFVASNYAGTSINLPQEIQDYLIEQNVRMSDIVKDAAKLVQQEYERVEDQATMEDLGYSFNAMVDVYRGVTRPIERLSMEDVGTGKKSFGWGLYLTGLPGIAKRYTSKVGGRVLEGTLDDTNIIGRDQVIPTEVQERIKQQAITEGIEVGDTNVLVRDFYKDLTDRLGSDKNASLFLSRAGIPGVKYTPQVGETTETASVLNYVIFDDSVMAYKGTMNFLETPAGEILGFEKNGKIYLDETKLNNVTTLHELTHVFQSIVDIQAKNGDLTAQQIIQKRAELFQETVDQWKNFHKNTPGVGRDINAMVIGEKLSEALGNTTQHLQRVANLGIAIKMEESGRSPQEIRRATLWERRADGKWRYEIPDSEFKKITPDFEKTYKLSDILADGGITKLFGDVDIKFINDRSVGAPKGFYNSTDRTITLNWGAVGANMGGLQDAVELDSPAGEELRSVLHHEITHIVQEVEGFEGGGNAYTLVSKTAEALGIKQGDTIGDAKFKILKAKAIADPRTQRVLDVFEGIITESDPTSLKNRMDMSYDLLFGEDEARITQKRLNFTEDQRREITLTSTSEYTQDFMLFLKGLQTISGNFMTSPTPENISAEREAIIQKAKTDGTYLKAPNGQPTNLTEGQWVTVRTQNFKNWFGDWENSPETASKVVDENGEPKVMYTGTSKDKEFDTFSIPKNGVWFTADPKEASQYAIENDSQDVRYNTKTGKYEDVNTKSRVIPVFLKADLIADFKTEASPEKIEKLRVANNYKKIQGELFQDIYFSRPLGEKRFDAIDYNGDGKTIVIIESPEQIKSAIGNTGQFNPNKKQIQFQAETTLLKDTIGLDLSSPVYAQRPNESNQAYNERLLKEVEAYMVAPEIVERMEQMRKDNPSLWKEIMSFINNLKEWLKSQIGLLDYQGDIMSMTKQEYVDALGVSILKDDYQAVANDRKEMMAQVVGERGAERVAEVIDAKVEAEVLEQQGKPMSEITARTGWFKDEGGWRYFSWETAKTIQIKEEATKILNSPQKLKEVIGENRIFDFYPELEDVTVEFYEEGPRAGGITVGTEYNGAIRINLGEEANRAREGYGVVSYDDQRTKGGKPLSVSQLGTTTLTHELSHVIQRMEGFPGGGGKVSTANIAKVLLGTNSTKPVEIIDLINAELNKEGISRNKRVLYTAAKELLQNAHTNSFDTVATKIYNLLYGEVEARTIEFIKTNLSNNGVVSNKTFTDFRNQLLEIEGLLNEDLIVTPSEEVLVEAMNPISIEKLDNDIFNFSMILDSQIEILSLPTEIEDNEIFDKMDNCGI